MITQLITLTKSEEDKAIGYLSDDQIQTVKGIWESGGLVAFPTETVYGLGANALDEEAVKAIYAAKGRPSDNPLIVHVSDIKMLEPLVREVQPYVLQLMNQFWPGPITFVLPKSDRVPMKTTGGLDTVAVRMPVHPVALQLIKACRMPIAAPSANLSGKPSPTCAEHVVRDMEGRIGAIVMGGETAVGLESTVLDVTGEVPVILRPGAITKEMIAGITGACLEDAALSSDQVKPKAPGMKYKHYAPDAKVTAFIGSNQKFIEKVVSKIEEAINDDYMLGLVLFEEDMAILSHLLKGLYSEKEMKEHVTCFIEGSFKAPETLATHLFGDLRKADDLLCREIYVHGVEPVGLGDAIMNRLKKAAEGRVVIL